MAGGRRHVPLAAGVEDMAVVREHFTRALERMHKAPKSGEPSRTAVSAHRGARHEAAGDHRLAGADL